MESSTNAGDLAAMWSEFLRVVGERLPGILAGLGILIIGWVGALILASLVKGAFKKTGLDRFITNQFDSGDTRPVQPGTIASALVFWTVILFVLVAFFQTLGLSLATEPLNQFLASVFAFAPRLISAVLLFLLAWILASVSRVTLRRVLLTAKADERFGSLSESREAADENAPHTSVTEAMATTAYWLVFLLFLPAILDALSVQGLLAPVEQMMAKVLGFLPNLFAAGLILLLGWLVARIVQRMATNLLKATGIDGLYDKVGLSSVLGTQALSEVLGLFVYFLILIPVVIQSLDALHLAAISDPATQMLRMIFQAVPSIISAGLLLLIAYMVARFLSGLTRKLLHGVGFDHVLEQIGVGKITEDAQRTPSEIAGYLVLVGIMLFAVIEAVGLLGLSALVALLVQFAEFAGHVLLGLVILGVGLYLANLTGKIIAERQVGQAKVLAAAARVSIVTLAGAMALKEMGLADEIIILAFGLLLGSVAVAAALALGLGSRDVAGRRVEKWIKSLEKAE